LLNQLLLHAIYLLNAHVVTQSRVITAQRTRDVYAYLWVFCV